MGVQGTCSGPLQAEAAAGGKEFDLERMNYDFMHIRLLGEEAFSSPACDLGVSLEGRLYVAILGLKYVS